MKKQIVLEESKYSTQVAGVLGEETQRILTLELPSSEVLIYPGVIKHIKKRHPHAFRYYFRKMPDILSNPDFVGISGQNPKRLEFVKRYRDTILVALKYNEDDQLFVSSMYIIEDSRIEKRMSYGRLIPVEEPRTSHKPSKQRYRNTAQKAR